MRSVLVLALTLTLVASFVWGQEQARQPHVIVHRQALQAAPENTWAALKQAVLWGADQTVTLEIDLFATKDGKLFLFHDTWFDWKNEEVLGHPEDWLWEEINDVDFGSWYDRRFKNERLPLFEDVLEFCKLNHVRLTLDPRESATREKIQAVLKKHDAEGIVYWGWRDGFGRLVGEQRKIMEFDGDRERIRQGVKQWMGDTIWVDDPRVLLDVLHREAPRREVKMPELSPGYRVEDLDFDTLLKQVRDGGDTGRIAAARLRKHFKERAGTAFVAVLSEPPSPSDVKTTVARALGRLGEALRGTSDGTKAAAALRVALTDSNVEVRAAAAYALGKLKDDGALSHLTEILRNAQQAEKVRQEAARALGRIGSAGAIAPLVETAREERAKANESLPRFGELAGELAKEKGLYWAVPQVLLSCYSALGEIGGEQALDFLLAQHHEKRLTGKDALAEAVIVRQHALTAAAKIGGPRALEAAKAETWEPALDTYFDYVRLTRYFEPQQVVPVLLEFLGHPKPYQRMQAMYALLRIGEPAVAPLIGLLQDMQASPLAREWATWTLGWTNDPRAVVPLRSGLNDSLPGVRATAAWAMGKMRVEDSAPRLQELTKDADPLVHEYAVVALERLRRSNR